MTPKPPAKSKRKSPSSEPRNGRAFKRDIKGAFYAVGADTVKLAFAFGAWWLIDWVLLQLFGPSPEGNQKLFTSMAHWASLLTIVAPRFLTVVTELLALAMRLLQVLAAGAQGIVQAWKTGKAEIDEGPLT